jgi:dTDP-4-dehydrorhamnose reductase
MRILLTGASGFVGSNLAAVFAQYGAELSRPSHAELDLADRDATLRFAAEAAPDAIVHAAILNDPVAMAADRHAAWAAYVGATRNVVDAANAGGAHVVLVSTDWVFDGTQGPAAEDAPPNPVNQYGFLKAASELVVAERADRGTVARIAGVQGVHRARPGAPRRQDHGFGYFVLSVVEALRAGEPFTVWESDAINMVATPTLATDAGRLIWRALGREAYGVLHCCGGEHVDRVTLARRAASAFGLDPALVRSGPPPEPPAGAVPYDTRLDATATARVLGVELPDLDTQLARLRRELESDLAIAHAARLQDLTPEGGR